MRRLVELGALFLGAIAVAVIALSSRGAASGRVDVIFDDAHGLSAGQVVKIAGANAGTIDNVVLTAGFKARIEVTVPERFLPFHADATCTIRPEALIAENYLDCDPGEASSPALLGSGGHPPTVPVTNTTEPVTLLDLFDIFNAPTRERLALLFNELGIGMSGEGEDVNAILRRANPALGLARQTIAILVRQRDQFREVLDATNTVLSQAAAQPTAVTDFVDNAARLSTLTAGHRDSLSSAVARLPRLLATADPALSQLDSVEVGATPLLNRLASAAPGLDALSSDLRTFVVAAKPGLAKLESALRSGIPALRGTAPLLSTIRSYADRSRLSTVLTAGLWSNLQQHGFFENFLSTTYYVSAALSRFDSTAHLISTYFLAPGNGACAVFATKPVPGCSARYGSAPRYRAASALLGLAQYLLK